MDTIYNQPTITLSQWIESGLTFKQYEHDKQRYGLVSTRACKGQEVQIQWSSLQEKRQALIKARFGDPSPKQPSIFSNIIEPDPEAFDFFTKKYKLPDGRDLPFTAQTEYCADAAVLKAIGKVVSESITMRRNMGNPVRANMVWDSVAKAVAAVDRTLWPHDLPENTRRLREKYRQFAKNGYSALIHKNFCNQSARKVDEQMEDLFIALYTTKNRHFINTVTELYIQWLAGNFELVNTKTGEYFNREDFKDENGTPKYISESTTWRYLSKPANRQVIKKLRDSAIDFKTAALPYNHRHKPNFTLSKVSFDDRDLPRRTSKGFEVKCYYAYEVKSQCFIGWAHSREKNLNLIYECFRSMLSFLTKQKLPWPLEAEVERHLMTQLKQPLEQMFPYVRWCVPQNSREKRAEHGIRSKKYGAEKLLQDNIGRWSNRHDAYKINQDETKIYEFDDLVADDIYSINWHNTQPHPDYPDKTRLQVLREMVNPDAGDPVMRTILRHIGYMERRTIHNHNFIVIQYKNYYIDAPKVLNMLAPNNYEVEAYFLPNENGDINELYLYQNDRFLCEAKLLEKYNEAQAERTEHDEEIRKQQDNIKVEAIQRVKRQKERLPKVEILRNMPDFSDITPEILDVTPDSSEELKTNNDSISYDPDYWSRLGKNSF
ncbi:MAG TPA: hypothetical protein VK207_09005 [Bacteroidales bacterium]|nr:hypothetical protein [Bacteroidales bacterium]